MPRTLTDHDDIRQWAGARTGSPMSMDVPDGTGSRTLATIRISGRDVGDILIEERLARRWPDGYEFWC